MDELNLHEKYAAVAVSLEQFDLDEIKKHETAVSYLQTALSYLLIAELCEAISQSIADKPKAKDK